MCRDASNLYGWTMSQKWPLRNFKWRKDLFRFKGTVMQIEKALINNR